MSHSMIHQQALTLRQRARNLAPSRGRSTVPRVTISPGGSPGTQRFTSGNLDFDMPLGAVQKLSQPLQAASVLAMLGGLGLSTAALCSLVELPWAHSSILPYYFGVTFAGAGVAHFGLLDQFSSMMPPQGTWGIWYLPGSDEFHVKWTGIAELAGGIGFLASTVAPVAEALPWLQSATALCLLGLTVAVTPANIFMFTHNAPGPGPEGVPIPPLGHAIRGILQVLLCATLWAFAHPVPA